MDRSRPVTRMRFREFRQMVKDIDEDGDTTEEAISQCLPDDVLQTFGHLLQEAITAVRRAAELRESNEHLRVITTSFSKVTEEDLDAIQLKGIDKGNISKEKLGKITTSLYEGMPLREEFESAVNKAWEAEGEVLQRYLSSVLSGVSKKPEPRSRMLVDDILKAVIRFTELLDDHAIGILPEHCLSQNSERSKEFIRDLTEQQAERLKNPTELVWEDVVLILTGIVDYIVLTLFGEKGEVAKALEKHLDTANLDQVVYLLESQEDPDFCVCLIEVKRLTNALRNHISQAIAEACVTSHKLGLKKITWCLTDGITWIFGVFSLTDRTYIYFETVPLVDPAHSKKVDGNATEALFKFLTVLAFTKPNLVYRAFNEL
ncbi:hypothetical protein EST38_g1520 [Candolleomyces aberdarensis]|uniref:Uncharacterized protein n=1 Tax=Candolleomyces aberdarensis TaxID=2316362 RepID=A0A4Q2DZ72_9AGAR|nr:hypothetical protein EST38_g1520 [Candolleomyces aberdarensis]